MLTIISVVLISVSSIAPAKADTIIDIKLSKFLQKHIDKVPLRADETLPDHLRSTVEKALSDAGLDNKIGRVELDVKELRLRFANHSVIRSFTTRMRANMKVYDTNNEMIDDRVVDTFLPPSSNDIIRVSNSTDSLAYTLPDSKIVHINFLRRGSGRYKFSNTQFADQLVARFACNILDDIVTHPAVASKPRP